MDSEFGNLSTAEKVDALWSRVMAAEHIPTDQLVPLLTNPDEELRAVAFFALGYSGDLGALEIVTQRLVHENSELVQMVCEAMTDSSPGLLHLLKLGLDTSQRDHLRLPALAAAQRRLSSMLLEGLKDSAGEDVAVHQHLAEIQSEFKKTLKMGMESIPQAVAPKGQLKLRKPQLNLLIVDDSEEDYHFLNEILRLCPGLKYEATWKKNFEDGLEAIAEGTHDAILVDYRLGARSGLELIREAVRAGMPAPMILLTGNGGEEVDRQAIQMGAANYLDKGELRPALLGRTIRYSVAAHRRSRLHGSI